MKQTSILAATLSPLLLVASCGATGSGDSAQTQGAAQAGDWDGEFAITEHGSFAEPWAAAFNPGTPAASDDDLPF